MKFVRVFFLSLLTKLPFLFCIVCILLSCSRSPDIYEAVSKSEDKNSMELSSHVDTLFLMIDSNLRRSRVGGTITMRFRMLASEYDAFIKRLDAQYTYKIESKTKKDIVTVKLIIHND